MSQTQRLNRRMIGAALIAAATGYSGTAHAIPAFAAQTGMHCSACHIGFPQLTPYGRMFKLQGYITGGTFPTWKNFALMSQTGFTQLHDKIAGGLRPGYKSNDAWVAAQQSSLYYGGAIDAALGIGAFIQVTYDNVSKSWHWDNTDIRLARSAHLFNRSLIYGFTFNNAPTVTDLWNSTPDWGYPFIHSYLAPAPAATPQVDQLAQEVYGVIVHSSAEAELLRPLLPDTHIETVAWAVPLRPTKIPFAERTGYGFVGGFRHPPNVDAVKYFVETIMPALPQPESQRFTIIGSNMPPEIAQLHSAGIDVRGHVPILADALNHLRCTIAPLRYGAGVKGKVLDPSPTASPA